MKENAMELDTLLRETAPMADPTHETLAAGRVALDAAIVTTPHEREGVRRNRARRRFRVGALVAAAATVALLVGPTFNVFGSRQRASADAAQVLLRAGAAAG